MSRTAVFLDRDGVLVHDRGLVTEPEQLELCAGAARAVSRLRGLGHLIVVVTNQPVVARGLITEAQVEALHEVLQEMLGSDRALIDRFYFCPHHPKADVERYRQDCDCRKPRPGMLERACRELDLIGSGSFMVGDRPSDVLAGARIGCRTILLRTGQHEAPPIETPDAPEWVEPDWVADTLLEAVDLIEEASA